MLDHQILPLILNKAGFNSRSLSFFFNYLMNRKTQYMWNNLIISFFRIDIDIRQESAFFLNLSTLYIVPIFHIFKKRPKNLFQNLAVSFLSFVDDGLFISQEKSFERSNIILFCSYNIITSFFDQVKLTVKHGKLEIFYFFTLTRNFNPFFWILLI